MVPHDNKNFLQLQWSDLTLDKDNRNFCRTEKYMFKIANYT